MDSAIILKGYWQLFLAHACEFYSFEKALIEKYADEMDWHKISKNQNIAWDFGFIAKNRERFLWRDLASNPAIHWTLDSIEQFKAKFEEIGWGALGSNPSLIVSEELLSRYKKLCVNEANVTWTPSLKIKFSQNIWPEYKDDRKAKPLDLTNIEKSLRKFGKHTDNNLEVYSEVFLPIINEITIEKILEEKFDYRQKYFFLEPRVNDQKGLIPQFAVQGESPFRDFSKSGLFKLDKVLTLVNSREQEGPDRLYEIASFDGYRANTLILVSENCRKVLDQFKLPAHYYHEVDLQPRQIKTTTKYYLLHLDYDTLTQDMDYASQNFYFQLWDHFKSAYGDIEEPISNFGEFDLIRKKLQERVDNYVNVYPEQYRLKTDYDIYSYRAHGGFVINEFVRDALEKAFPNHAKFASAQLLNIKIDQIKYDEKRQREIDLSNLKKVEWVNRKDMQFFLEKAARLKDQNLRVTINETENDEFIDQELFLNVLFPKKIKNKIKKNKLTIEGYSLLPIEDFYSTDEFLDRYPETYKAVIIANNEYGDLVGLILEKKSDFLLQSKLYEFLHESGEIQVLADVN